MISTVANLRTTTEHRIANDYTYRQLQHIAVTYAKDRFMVVGEIMRIVTGSMSKTDKTKTVANAVKEGLGESSTVPKADARGLPPWFRPRYRPGSRNIGNHIVNLDGPMQRLAPFVGKGKLKKLQQDRAKQLNKELKGK